MKNLKTVLLAISYLIIITSCGSDDEVTVEIAQDPLLEIIEDCSENSLTSKEDIESNIIGKWDLVGFSQTLFPDDPQPEISLDFSSTTVLFDNKTRGVLETYEWEIEEEIVDNEKFFSLSIGENFTPLSIHAFCEKNMYVHTLPLFASSGYIYIYEKVE